MILFTVGVVLILVSAFYVSSYLSILGGSLLFWAGILAYIRPTKHIPIAYLTALTVSNASNIERLLTEYNFSQKGVYLPPKNLRNAETSIIFVPKTPNQNLPKPEETSYTRVLSNEQDSLFLTPPGLVLSQIYEKELGVSFIKNDFAYLQKNLPKLLIDNLAIAECVEIEMKENKIIVNITNSIFSDDCIQTQDFPKAHSAVGCLLVSSIACALAKVTGKPITITKEQQSEDRKTSQIEYQMGEE